MKKYNVTFEITDIEEENAIAAALTVEELLQDCHNHFTYTVQEEGSDKIVSIDLEEEIENCEVVCSKYVPTITSPHIKVILEVKGGIVNNVIADGPIEYILVDWDNLEAGDEFPTEEHFRCADEIVDNIEASLTRLRIDNILKNGEVYR